MMSHALKNIFLVSLASLVASDAFAAGADHAEKSKGGLPQLDPTWFASQIFWLLITFGILYALFASRVLPDLTKTLEERNEHIQGDLDMADKLQKEAQDAHDAYDAVMAEAAQEASKLYTDIDIDLKKKSDKEYKAFAERITNEIRVSEGRIDKVKKEIIEEIDTAAVEIVSQALNKVASLKVSDALITKTIKVLEEAA